MFVHTTRANLDLVTILIGERHALAGDTRFVDAAATRIGRLIDAAAGGQGDEQGYLTARAYFGALIAFMLLQDQLGLASIRPIDATEYIHHLAQLTARGTVLARKAAAGPRLMTLGGWWHPPCAGPYYDAMSAQPAEHHEDPLDPQRILRELPDRERANFLAAYREALDGTRDPAGWGHLRRVLRFWSGMVIAANRPGFYEAQEAALTGTGGGMLLEDYIRLRRTQA